MHNRTRLIVILISFILCTAGGLKLYDLWRDGDGLQQSDD